MALKRVLPKRALRDPEADPHLNEEWLVTNGLGGYASGTVSGAITRRYHGLLIAAMPNPLGRMMMLNGLSERLRLPDHRVVYTGAEELAGVPPESTLAASEFRLEAGLPVWRYEVDGFVLEKRLLLTYRQNTVHVTYRLLSGKEKCRLRLGLRPAIHFRGHDETVSATPDQKYVLTVSEDQFEITSTPDLPMLRLLVRGPSSAFTFDRKRDRVDPLSHRAQPRLRLERLAVESRLFPLRSGVGDSTTLIASTESWEVVRALGPEDARRAEIDRRALLLAAAPEPARNGFGAELDAGGRSVPDHARRPRRRCRARSRRRRRNPHRHRRLPLVHGLGPRHHDQPRRPHACHRPQKRSGLDSAHLRLLHSRRPDPQHVSRRQ